MIIVCVSVACFILVVIIIYVVWRSHRCGFTGPSNSNLCLSVLEFADLIDDKGNVTAKKGLGDDSAVEGSTSNKLCRRASADSACKRACLQYRLRWNKRRRRLRQIHPALRTLLRCWYVVSDCLTCKPNPTDHCSSALIMTSPLKSEIQSDLMTQTTSITATMKPTDSGHQFCPLLDRFRSRKVSRGFFSRPRESSDRPPKSRCLTEPLRSEEDDAFEAHTLCMRLDKPVAYVANHIVNATRNNSVSDATATSGTCMKCGVIGQLSCNLCLTCRNSVVDDQDAARKAVTVKPSQGLAGSEMVPLPCGDQDLGFSLTQSSMQLLTSGPHDLGWSIKPDKLFSMAYMTHLLHPK